MLANTKWCSHESRIYDRVLCISHRRCCCCCCCGRRCRSRRSRCCFFSFHQSSVGQIAVDECVYACVCAWFWVNVCVTCDPSYELCVCVCLSNSNCEKRWYYSMRLTCACICMLRYVQRNEMFTICFSYYLILAFGSIGLFKLFTVSICSFLILSLSVSPHSRRTIEMHLSTAEQCTMFRMIHVTMGLSHPSHVDHKVKNNAAHTISAHW